MDIILPYAQTKDSDFELRYSLRSLSKFGKGFGELIIIGDKPDWMRNVHHIQLSNNGNHEKNIYQKILAACHDDSISKDVLLWNDDYILTTLIDFTDYPNYACKNDLEWLVDDRMYRFDAYRMAAVNTIKQLQSDNQTVLNFDTHTPIIYNRAKFIEVMQKDWKVSNGYLIKSLYANQMKLKPNFISDPKYNGSFPKGIKETVNQFHVFSLGERDNSDAMINYLKETFTEPSMYES